MRKIAKELCETVGLPLGPSGMKSTVFEDNNGALSIAKAKRLNPRTKHIATQYHWWWSVTEFKPATENKIKLEKIDTLIQWADMFTKPLERTTFEAI